MFKYLLTILAFFLVSIQGWTQSIDTNRNVHEYNLTVDYIKINPAGKEIKAMSVNGSIPGPTLRFKEGEYAVIYVKNNMDVETSVHWHGILLPNFSDGVPYLTTPPIKPGKIQKYEFKVKQTGTYWYHSHTNLQEQIGVFGSIVIEPKTPNLSYDKDLLLLISDWTNQNPTNVLRNLKRGNEWYNIKKRTSTPLNQVIAKGALGAQLKFWRQRMESADIADVYYNAFLINGKKTNEYADFNPGEKVRVRIINASASSQYWLTFGGDDPFLVAADGPEVEPVRRNKTFIAIAETYDFIVTIPSSGKVEIRASVQDGSGQTNAYLGNGEILSAPDVPRPDKIMLMKKMAQMKMRMGAPAIKWDPNKEQPKKMMQNWGMKMNPSKKNMKITTNDESMKMNERDMKMDTSGIENKQVSEHKESIPDKEGEVKMNGMDMFAEYNYNYLKSPEKTNFSTQKLIKEVLLNLTGNMNRYIWSMNGVPLSEADKIEMKKGEIVRLTLNNLTMMHHPMHLHGHFFRVINDQGEYSPLKHTVNVPPMKKVVIEFDASEEGNWFFHCHVLYHMMSGMARVYQNGQARDQRLKDFPERKLLKDGNHFYTWGMAEVASHMAAFNLVSSNLRNQFNINAEYGWNKNIEVEATYERYLYDYFRVFAGINVENVKNNSLEKFLPVGIMGIRFLTPYLFNLDVRIDSKLRPQISIQRSIMILPRTMLFGYYEYQGAFGWYKIFQDKSNRDEHYNGGTTWSVGIRYFISRNISLMGSYDNRFGGGGGLTVRF